jgi:hypothetical protein
VARFFGALKRSFPLLKQGAATKIAIANNALRGVMARCGDFRFGFDYEV